MALALPAFFAATANLAYSQSCDAIVADAVRFPVGRVSALSAENPIDLVFATDAMALETIATTSRHYSCRESAARVRRALGAFFLKRLNHLIAEGDIDGAHEEIMNLMAPRASAADRWRLREELRPLEPLYLQKLWARLQQRLIGTPWERFNTLRFSLESWGADWDTTMPESTPAAVHFADRRVALRPLDYEPLELEIFLFHELAHLSDGLNADKVAEETAAWRQTLNYLAVVRARGGTVPALFTRIELTIRALGGNIAPWVRAVHGD